MSEKLNINSTPYRENKTSIEYHVAGNLESFYTDINEGIQQMFGSRLTIEDLDDNELADIENFVEYATKRIAAGAITSKVFQENVEAGKLHKALSTFAPSEAGTVGHDSIHAMFAYIESGGASLVPAYMQVAEVINSRGVSIDDRANLEEHYVGTFSGINIFLEKIAKDLIDQGLSGEKLVQALIDKWDKEQVQQVTSTQIQVRNPNYVKENLLPEFVTIIRNYCNQLESGYVDPKFSLREFQRILRPLLDRLKNKKEHDDDMFFAEQ